MSSHDEEERRIRSTALQNAASILHARQRADDDLARAISTLRATLEATTDAILVVDNDGALTNYNERFLRMWGLDRERLASLHHSDLVAVFASRVPGARELFSSERRNAARPEGAVDVLELIDGRVIECSSAPHAVDGRSIGRVWSFRDITERQRGENAVAATHARFAAVIDQSPVGILIVDSQMRIQHVNPRALLAFGADARLVGLSLEDVIEIVWPSSVADVVVAEYRRTLTTGEPYRSENASEVRKDRMVEEYFDWELHRIALPDGQIGVACYFINVTTHVLAQRALQASEQRVRATFEQAGVGMAVASLDGRFLQMNRKFTQILGRSEAELRRRTFLDITHPDDLVVTHGHVTRLLAGEVDHYSLEKRYLRGDGTVVWSLTTVALLRSPTGEPTEFVGVIEDVSLRREVEDRFRESSQRLQLALSAGELGDWSWDARTDTITLGPRASDVFGLPRGEAITWTALRELLHEQDRERARLAVEAALRDHTDYSLQHRIRRTSGEEAWVDAKGRGIYHTDGSVDGMIGVVQDVTERRRLEASRFRLAAVVETSDDAIVSKTLTGIITTWNRAAQRMFGYTEEEVVGRSVTILIPQSRLHEEAEILARLVAGQRIDHFETMRLRKDGTEFPVSLTVSPIKDDEGNIIGVSKIARDITTKRQAEDALRDETRVLNLLNETGRSIAGDLDLQSIVQTVTDSARQLTGAEFGAFFYNVTDERGDTYQLYTLSGAPREAFEKFGHPRATPLFGPTFAGEGPIRSDDVTLDPRYGRMAPHHGMPSGHLPVRSYLAVPVVSRSGAVIGGLFFGHSKVGVFTEKVEQVVVGVAAQAAIAIDNARLYEDVKRAADERQLLLDAERAARSDAERAGVMKDEFLATLSHELRTPLNAIVGWAQVLHARSAENPQIAEGLAVIDRNARVQAQLIEDLLDMSRIISGKLRLDAQRVELQDVVDAAVDSVRHSADARGIRLDVVMDPVPAVVLADPHRLQQCFWNLLSNAIKFTPKAGSVSVALSRVDSHFEVRVADTGQGIEPEFVPYVFERFRQADASTTRRHGGLGLGLSIVKCLVELHGGSVHARSAGKGLGATFWIDLPPLAVDSGRAGAPGRGSAVRAEASRLALPVLRGVTVLAVDDENDARLLVKRILEDCGARVVTAESAAAGLVALQRERPDVLVSDIGMPGEDGYEFIRKVRQLPPELGGRTPAAALSAFAREQDRSRALRAGFQTHIAKPVEPSELMAVIASLVRRD
jgi:PAS domain S-box-containing protein